MLKKWHHIDGFDKQSFEGLHDNVLYDMLWTDWDEVGHNGAASTKNPSAAASASMSRASTTDGRETKKARVVDDWELEGLADQLFASDAEDEDGDDKQVTSMLWSKAESDSAGSLGEKSDSDDEALAIPVPSKRKATRIASPPDESRSRSTSVLPKDMQKKHDLKEIAERGQGGRVMFVFEKITKSKMTDRLYC